MFFYLFLQKQKIALGHIPLGYSLKKGRRLRNVYWGSDDDTAIKRSSVQADTGSDSVCVTPYGQKNCERIEFLPPFLTDKKIKSRSYRTYSAAVSGGFRSETRRFGNYHEVWFYFVLFVF